MGVKKIQGNLDISGKLYARDNIYFGENDNTFISSNEIIINGNKVVTEDTLPDISGGSGEAIDVTIDENSTLQDIVNALIAADKDYTKANLISVNSSYIWVVMFSGETSGVYFVSNLESGFCTQSGGLFAQVNAYNLLSQSLIYYDNDGNAIDTGWHDTDDALVEIHRTLGNKMPYLFVNCDSSTRLSAVGEAMTTNGMLGKAVVVSVSGFRNGTYILTLSSQGGTRYSMLGIDLGTFSSIYSSSVDTSTIYLRDFVDNTCEGWVSYQKATDTSLSTTSKTIVGAINELDDRLDALVGDYSKGLEYVLNEDGVSYSVKKGACTDTEVVIPRMYNGLPVTTIGPSAFFSSTSLTSVKIPDSVTRIEGMAFNQCGLTNIEIPNSVTSIGMGAFANCPLTSAKIGKSITKIEGTVFANCSTLSSIVLPSSVVEIDNNAFRDCSALTIYCEAETQPEGWLVNWNFTSCPVVWGCSLDIPAINDALNAKADRDEIIAYIDNTILNGAW